MIVRFLGYTLKAEGHICKGTRIPKQFRESVDDCYTACKGVARYFMYHVKGRMGANCKAKGCSCACFEGCTVKEAEYGNVYEIST